MMQTRQAYAVPMCALKYATGNWAGYFELSINGRSVGSVNVGTHKTRKEALVAMWTMVNDINGEKTVDIDAELATMKALEEAQKRQDTPEERIAP